MIRNRVRVDLHGEKQVVRGESDVVLWLLMLGEFCRPKKIPFLADDIFGTNTIYFIYFIDI